MKGRFLELLAVVATVAVLGVWTAQSGEKKPSSSQKTPVAESSPQKLRATINGIELGMTEEEVVSQLGPSLSNIPGSSEKLKMMMYGREERADGMGFADFTSVGYSEDRHVVHISGSRLQTAAGPTDFYSFNFEDPKSLKLLVSIFGQEGVDNLRKGEKATALQGDLTAWKSGPGLIFRKGERP